MIQLRDYQVELASTALEGKNVIICAPTGSGKTHVAMHVVQEHLKQHRDHKVAFIVDKNNLAEQQTEQFKSNLPDFSVTELSGGTSSSNSTVIPLIRVLPEHDVFIISAQLLCNAFREKNEADRLDRISQFNLIIFDECHHCNKEHPFNKILDHYFEEKLKGGPLPQIIGLTASPGTGKAKNTDEAICHILKICAHMDAHSLRKTEEMQASLLEHQVNPNEEIIRINMRKYDFLGDILNHMMDFGEDSLKIFYPTKIPSSERGCHKYTNFIGVTKNYLPTIEDTEMYKEAFACWIYLKYLSLTMTLNWLFRSCDAVAYVKKMLLPPLVELEEDDDEQFERDSDVEVQPTCETDKMLRERLQAGLECSVDKVGKVKHESENPLLVTIRDIVLDQLKRNNDSRIIIFVKERSYATAMKRFFNTDAALKEVGCNKLVGSNAASEVGGSSKSEQIDVVHEFRNGLYKVLIATTVAEEGLDITKCNLVIRYATVTNEIAMVQSKGRGRAKDSRYIVIVPHHEDWLVKKESVNKARDGMMHEAIEQIRVMPDAEYQRKIQEIQMSIMQKKKLEEQARKRRQKEIADNAYLLYCLKCRQFACDTTSLRLLQSAHHVSLCKDLLLENRMRVRRGTPEKMGRAGTYESMGKVECANCASTWGSFCRVDGIAHPNLAIKNFTLKNPRTGEFLPKAFKKWKDAKEWFTVPALTLDEAIARAEGPLGPDFKISTESSDEESS